MENQDIIKFLCGKCEKKIGVPSSYAGKHVKCPRCSQAVQVPFPEVEETPVQPEIPAADFQTDAISQNDIGDDSDSDNIWSDDMFDSEPATSVPSANGVFQDADEEPEQHYPVATKTPRKLKREGSLRESARIPMIVVGGLVGAFIGAAIWTGIVYATGFQIGYVACAVGALAAIGIRVATGDTSSDFGWQAVVFAVIGIFAGKFLTIQWIAIPGVDNLMTEMLTNDEMIGEMARDNEAMLSIVVKYKQKNGEFDEVTGDLVINYLDEVEIPSERIPEIEHIITQAEKQLAGMNYSDKKDLAKETMLAISAAASEKFKKEITYMDKLKFAFEDWYFDLLWFIFAMLAAWKIGSGL